MYKFTYFAVKFIKFPIVHLLFFKTWEYDSTIEVKCITNMVLRCIEMFLKNKYILLDVLLCSIAEYFYKLYHILTSPYGESKYKQQVKILSNTTK